MGRKFRILDTANKPLKGNHKIGGMYMLSEDYGTQGVMLKDTEGESWGYYPFEVEEVLDRVIAPDLFESYLLGMYDAFGGDSGDNDLTRQILGKVLNKYKGLNK
jgi:hypothetical protein